MKARLGKGLGAILSGVDGDRSAPDSGGTHPAHLRGPGEDEASAAAAEPEGELLELEIGRIQPNPLQPRRTFEASALEELRDSIQRHGVLQPVVVRRVGEGYELIAGERRWRASRLAGLERVPAVVRPEVDEPALLELALVENVQRQDLDPIERALGYRQMVDRLGLTQEQVAQRVGLKRATIANHLRLLELPRPVQDSVARENLTMGHARAILGLDGNDADRIALAGQVAGRDLSVRETERIVRERNQGGGAGRSSSRSDTGKDGAPVSRSREPWVGGAEDRLRQSLGTKVRLENKPGYRGQIVVDYYNRADLDRLLDQLAPKRQV